MIRVRCPICDCLMQGQGPAEWPQFPFCSDRCRLIDLGRWLGESYRIPDPDSSVPSGDDRRRPGLAPPNRPSIGPFPIERGVAARPTTPLFFAPRCSAVRFSVFGKTPCRTPKTESPNTVKCPSSSTVTTCCTLWACSAGRWGRTSWPRPAAGLIGLMGAAHAADSATVVFDARRAPTDMATEENIGPVHVEYATGEEADDRIEWLIAHDAAPKRLVVVSDDNRLRQAAKRRGCPAWKCDEYLNWLAKERRKQNRPAAGEKPAGVGPLETDRWLAAFGDLDRDPAWDEPVRQVRRGGRDITWRFSFDPANQRSATGRQARGR